MKEKKQDRSAGGRIEAQAEGLAAPIADQFGIFIYDVEYVREGQDYYLNVYIDKEGGVTIGDCENVSRLLSDALDEKDFIRDPYTLVVSSPGLGRALTKDRHLRQSIGQEVEIHLYKADPLTGEKDLRGELESFDDSRITILAQPPVPGKKKRKGAGKRELPEQGVEKEGPQLLEDGRMKRSIERAAAASVRLAFDFDL